MRTILLVAVSVVLLPISGANAVLMFQPLQVQTNMGSFGSAFDVSQLATQGGLNTTYTSGVTDASAYTSTHSNNADEWQAVSNTTTGFVSFDLGMDVELTGIRLWQSSWFTGGEVDVRDFRVLSDDDLDATNGNGGVLGTFTAAQSNGQHPMQSFDFAQTTIIRFAHLEILSNYGGETSGLSEVAFVGLAVVPEPSSAILLALGSVVVFARRRRCDSTGQLIQ